MPTADAVDREAAWLTTSGDGLPALLKSAGGPFEIVQAYWPRTPKTQATGLYVLRAVLTDPRIAAQRIRPSYEMTLDVWWPVRQTVSSLLEAEQRAMDAAIELVRQRIAGFTGDKSHGGRFLSAGESPGKPARVEVRFERAEQTMQQDKALRASVVYTVDDFEISG